MIIRASDEKLFLCSFAWPLHLCGYMQLPFFYITDNGPLQKVIVLDEETSRHIIQVLRMTAGEKLNLTDGKGKLILAEITDAHKKHCTVKVIKSELTSPPPLKVSIAISLLKSASRFEWFLEKATEIGVSVVIPLICARTEKQKFRHDRMKGICISAMLQSRQTWLPELQEPRTLDWTLKNAGAFVNMIAHCGKGEKHTIPELIAKYPGDNYTIYIGPEGDFTVEEIEYAHAMQCFDVTLGETRLRTETAGVVAATLLTYH
jgi:16S rRNA (uracil1498-N3)-methyltransferase